MTPLIPETSTAYQVISLGAAALKPLLVGYVLADLTSRRSTRHTMRWWIATDLKFEVRPFVAPVIVIATVQDVLRGFPAWTVAADLLLLLLWCWLLLLLDDDDPRGDRWGRRRRAVRRAVTPARARTSTSTSTSTSTQDTT